MCHDYDSVPAPLNDSATNGHIQEKELALLTGDGNRFVAYSAQSALATDIGVVVMPDIRGLHNFYRVLASSIAGTGKNALAIDYFGRTAENDDRSDQFDFQSHLPQVTAQHVAADVAAAVEYLRSAEGGGSQRIFTLGFCFGGGYSWRQAADQARLSGAIGFYGVPALACDAAAQMRAPLLILAAGADAHIPLADTAQLAVRANDGGARVNLVAYPKAPHSFFDRSFAEHQEVCADAWRNVESFIARVTT